MFRWRWRPPWICSPENGSGGNYSMAPTCGSSAWMRQHYKNPPQNENGFFSRISMVRFSCGVASFHPFVQPGVTLFDVPIHNPFAFCFDCFQTHRRGRSSVSRPLLPRDSVWPRHCVIRAAARHPLTPTSPRQPEDTSPNPPLKNYLNRETREISESKRFFRVVGVFRGSLHSLYWHGF